jgi:hypothetical protein
MLSRLSRWGRAAAYLVVLIGLPVWQLTTDGPRDPVVPSAILVGAYVAYIIGSTAERSRRKALRRKLFNDNRET